MYKKRTALTEASNANSNGEKIFGAPETIRESSIITNPKDIKPITVHLPKHRRASTDEDFGFYLAGLIDGDGSFQGKQLILAFYELDAPLAYYVKRGLGYGSITKIKSKRALKLVISHREGIRKILKLIDGKLRNSTRIEQVKKNWGLTLSTPDNSNLLDNYWLAGFSDADASFQVKTIPRGNRTEIRLNFQVDLKSKDLLELIKSNFGGYIGYRKSQDTYYYGSVSFSNAKKIITHLL